VHIVVSCACLGDGRTVILEPPLSTGAGGRSAEKTSPGMVDRPSKRQGPGPACGEVETVFLPGMAVLTGRASDQDPETTEQGVRYAHQPARRSPGPWARHPRPAPPPS
jgi:hypothetical protein